jgi:nucleotide-binding universal stress UspA family protein
MFKKILCPIDGSDHARKALDLAIDIAKKYSAELIILHVPHRTENIEALQRFAEIEGLTEHVGMELDRLRAMDFRVGVLNEDVIQDAGISPRLLIEVGQHIVDQAREYAQDLGLKNVDVRVEGGDPANRILESIADDKIDCVVMGSRGLGGLKGMFLGSVSHKVANHAPCTCIAVK